jgi:Fic family protein
LPIAVIQSHNGNVSGNTSSGDPTGEPDEDQARALQRARDLAIAEALGGLGRVALTLSSRLREIHQSAQPVAVDSAADGAAAGRSRTPRGGLGPRQRRVMDLGGMDSETGLTASDVGKALGFTAANVTSILKRLTEIDLLEQVPDERPARWRRPPV